jgi:hypothetical protein
MSLCEREDGLVADARRRRVDPTTDGSVLVRVWCAIHVIFGDRR